VHAGMCERVHKLYYKRGLVCLETEDGGSAVRERLTYHSLREVPSGEKENG
jgi:hypothetical protein